LGWVEEVLRRAVVRRVLAAVPVRVVRAADRLVRVPEAAGLRRLVLRLLLGVGFFVPGVLVDMFSATSRLDLFR
jgi:hypothetical protein